MFEPRCRPCILCGTWAWAGCELDHPRVTGSFAATRSIPLGSARVWLVMSRPLLRRGYRARPPRPILAPIRIPKHACASRSRCATSIEGLFDSWVRPGEPRARVHATIPLLEQPLDASGTRPVPLRPDLHRRARIAVYAMLYVSSPLRVRMVARRSLPVRYGNRRLSSTVESTVHGRLLGALAARVARPLSRRGRGCLVAVGGGGASEHVWRVWCVRVRVGRV